jgi:hypothetical protein
MSTKAKFNAVIWAVAATLATIVATPSWAGDHTLSQPAAAVGGMGFGPMGFSLLDAARLTKPVRGEDPTPNRGDVVLAASRQAPPPSAPVAIPLWKVAYESSVTMARNGE